MTRKWIFAKTEAFQCLSTKSCGFFASKTFTCVVDVVEFGWPLLRRVLVLPCCRCVRVALLLVLTFSAKRRSADGCFVVRVFSWKIAIAGYDVRRLGSAIRARAC